MKLTQIAKYILTALIAFLCGLILPAAYVTLFATTTTEVSEAKPVVNSEFTTEDMGDVYLFTDNLTGCQYIKPYRGGITPRMYSDGIQVCGQSTYPNGEHAVTMDSDGFPPNVFSKNTPE